MMGIGGGTLAVPTLNLCGYPIHRAVGTAAFFGMFISIPGTVGYLLAEPPAACRGRPSAYVSLSGLAVIVPGLDVHRDAGRARRARAVTAPAVAGLRRVPADRRGRGCSSARWPESARPARRRAARAARARPRTRRRSAAPVSRNRETQQVARSRSTCGTVSCRPRRARAPCLRRNDRLPVGSNRGRRPASAASSCAT